MTRRPFAPSAVALAVGLALSTPSVADPNAGDWTAYGRTPGGDRHAPLSQINVANVARLREIWRLDTGEDAQTFPTKRTPRFEATPLVIDGVMYLSTPLGRAMAIDPTDGRRLWTFDPMIDRTRNYGDFASRGVSFWRDTKSRGTCARRIFLTPIDARLVALDAVTGKPCVDFGRRGSVDLREGLRNAPFEPEEYQQTSPPAVVGDRVIVGSSVADNNRTDAASGEVRAYDARSGRLLWTFDPTPQDPRDPAYGSWRGSNAHRTGGANVWSVMAADPKRNLVFLPTSSPSPDYYGGERLGDNRYGSSVVALDARTGRVVWSFQTVHHDLWDYDNAAPPALVTVRHKGKDIPALLQATKSGQLFVLDRRNGRPIFPVTEAPAPASDVAGEEASPTQPVSQGLPALSPRRLSAEDIRTSDVADKAACLARLAELRNDGPFTPPSLQGSLVRPSNVGGAHWGGLSFDPRRQIVVVATNRVAAIVRLYPTGAAPEPLPGANRIGLETTRMRGTPYTMRRELFYGPSGQPCTPGPAGALHAIDLNAGRTAWEAPLGEPDAEGRVAGELNFGGPLTTDGDLTLIGAALDGWLRVYRTSTGELLWKQKLPGVARSTPMTYRDRAGRQRVVIAVGRTKTDPKDQLVVFGLP